MSKPSSEEVDEMIERAVAAQSRKAPEPYRSTWAPRKRDRPRCNAHCRSTGKPCQARVVWDREKNAPRNGRCRMHSGHSTGPRTASGWTCCDSSIQSTANHLSIAVGMLVSTFYFAALLLCLEATAGFTGTLM